MGKRSVGAGGGAVSCAGQRTEARAAQRGTWLETSKRARCAAMDRLDVTRILGALLLVTASAACRKHEEAKTAGTSEVRAPDRDPAREPSSAPGTSGSQPFSGTVRLDPGAPSDAVRPTDVLFIMARESVGGGQAGRLIATARHSPATLPLAFEIGEKDMMVPGTPFTGPFILSARLDRDGDPMTRGADDLYATAPGEVRGGQKGLELSLKLGASIAVEPSRTGAGGAPSSAPASQPQGSR